MDKDNEKDLYFDCSSGAAGDMISAALLGLMEHPEKIIETINSMGLEDTIAQFAETIRQGVAGHEFTVEVDEEVEEAPDHYHEDHDHPHFDRDHDHYHDDHYHDHPHFHEDHYHTRPHDDRSRDHYHNDHYDHCHHERPGDHFHDDHPHWDGPRGPFCDHESDRRRPCPPFFRGPRPDFCGPKGAPIELHFHLHIDKLPDCLFGECKPEKRHHKKHKRHHSKRNRQHKRHDRTQKMRRKSRSRRNRGYRGKHYHDPAGADHLYRSR